MVSRDRFAPHLRCVVQTAVVRDVVAENGEVGGVQSPVLGRGGVGEFEAVMAIVEPDVERVGLIEVAEEGRGSRQGGMRRGNALREATKGDRWLVVCL